MELNGIVFGGKKKKVSCSYCGRDVTMLCRVHCAVCPDFKLCNDCFSVGVRLLPHEPSHAYRVVDCLDVPIFAKDWTASEELLLLEGIERCGAGNWKTIADYINSSVVPQGVGKSHKQVEEHYWERYMGVHGNCLPAKYVAASGELADTAPVLQDKDANRCAVVHGYKLGEAVVRDRPVSNSLLPPVNSSSSSSSSSSNLAHQSDSQKDKKFDRSHGHDKGQDASKLGAAADRAEELRLRHLALPGADLQGFLPLREDFDVEHDNDAELLLAEMEFSPDDHPSEHALKLEVIKIYNKKLDERNRRKRFAIDRGLIDFRKQQQAERKRNKDERDLVARLRVFARFQTPEEHEALVDGLVKARKLRNQIALYQHYRKMGVRTLEQGRQYEIDRRKRENEARAQKQRQQTPYLFQTASSAAGGDNTRRRGADDGVATAGAGAGLGESGVGDARTIGASRKRSTEDTAATLSKAPGFELLSPKEVELCTSTFLLPMHYLAIKEALVREAYRNGSLTLDGMQRLVRLEQPKAVEIFDFFVRDTGLGLAGSSVAAGAKRVKTDE